MGRAALTVLAALSLVGCGSTDEEPAPRSLSLTVEQALAAEADEPVTVRGSLFVQADETRLCSALAESHPPQCGGPSLVVAGAPPSELPALRRSAGVAWSERQVTLRGLVADGTLRVLEDRD